MIRDEVTRARAEMFVGRVDELAAIARLLAGDDELRFLYLEGPGGIGKTSILRVAAERAGAGAWSVAWIDGRSQAWTAEALASAMSPDVGAGQHLVVVDSMEAIADIDVAMSVEVLPALPRGTRILGAGRHRFGSPWRHDDGWRRHARSLAIGPLTPDEATAYLERRRVPADRHAELAGEAGRHPLVLALLADLVERQPRAAVRLDRNLPVVTALVDRLLADASPALVEALRAAAILLHANEADLAAVVTVADPRGQFDELRRLSFVESRPDGLLIHDVVRNALLADLAWRDPGRRMSLMRRAARVLFSQWPAANGEPSPIQRKQNIHLVGLGGMLPVEPVRRDDLSLRSCTIEQLPLVEAMILAHEGPGSLGWFRYWRERGARVITCMSGDLRVVGFYSQLRLHAVSREDAAIDPGTAGLWDRWEASGLRASGPCHYVRHWMGDLEHQAVSQVQTTLSNDAAMFHARPVALAMWMAEPATWEPFFVPGLTPVRIPELDHELEGATRAVLVKELRDEPLYAWLRRMAEAPLGLAQRSTRLELDLPGFATAVREALRVVDRLDVLERCELVAATEVGAAADREGDGLGRARSVATLLRTTTDEVLASPRDATLRRILYLTYFEPLGKHEAVAAELGLSYATYRRHLARATTRVTEVLWARERAARVGS